MDALIERAREKAMQRVLRKMELEMCGCKSEQEAVIRSLMFRIEQLGGYELRRHGY